MAKNAIKNSVKGCTTVKLDSLNNLLKESVTVKPGASILKLKESVIKYGVSFPILVWKDKSKVFILDGEALVSVVTGLREDGYAIPDIPVIIVKAKNRKEALKMTLIFKSHYAKIQQKGFSDFVDGLDMEALSGVISIAGIKFDLTPTEIIEAQISKTVNLSYTVEEHARLDVGIAAINDHLDLGTDVKILLYALEAEVNA